MKNTNKQLIEFIKKSPSMFHAVTSIKEILDTNGFTYLKEADDWNVKEGKFYTIRNNSSIIAFDIPKKLSDYHFQISASHSDSPCYKIKAVPELGGPSEYLRLDVESYGGMIDYTWFDKPLTVAGRVFVKEKNKIVSKLLYIDRDLLIIPSQCIHFNRSVNEGIAFNRAIDLCPLFSAGQLGVGSFDKMIANELGVKVEDIASKDLFIVNRQEGKEWGYENEFISAPKLDDLQAAFASLQGFINSKNPGCINVYACFDNEEVGSGTKQGAESDLLKNTLTRINVSLGKNEVELYKAFSKSFMVSFDNAHAVHPNHPEKTDSVNCVFMNKGIVVKENASQKYTTDAFSRAVFNCICDKAKVPVQCFANRSDVAGGSTLGNISNEQVSLHAVDIGIAQLAMHSSYETAGSKDTDYAIEALKSYYSSMIQIDGADGFSIK